MEQKIKKFIISVITEITNESDFTTNIQNIHFIY